MEKTTQIENQNSDQRFSPHFRVLVYDRTTNIGDAIQTVAITRLLGGVCAGVFRDSPLPELYSEIPFVINGWMGYGAPQSARNCIFAGVHLGNREPEYVRWIRKSEGLCGARDGYTQGLLSNNRIASEMIACATLTLPLYRGPRQGRYSIDVEPIPGTQFETNLIPHLCWSDQWNLALHRLEQLRKAEVVYTRRLHVILPCLAFGTPVVFPTEEFRDLFDKTRFSLLHDIGFVHDEPVEMDVTSIAEKYIEFLATRLNAPIRPVDQPTMPIPIVPPVAENASGWEAEAKTVSSSRNIPVQMTCRPAPSVSALVMTRNGANRLPRCLESIRRTGFAKELVVCVDGATTDESVEVARSLTSHVHLVQSGYPEMLTSRLISLCPGNFVLRIDDDEQLGGDWEKTYFELMVKFNGVTHFWTPCRWVVPPGDQFIASHPWFPDLQMRLFANNPRIISCPTRVHERVKVGGPSLILYDRWIEHHNLVLSSRSEREVKCGHYLNLRPDHDVSDVYLCDDKSLPLMPLTTPALTAADSVYKTVISGLFEHYEPDSTLDFRLDGDAVNYTLGGWSEPEGWGTWTIDRDAELRLPLREPMVRGATLIAEVQPFVTPEHPVSHVQVLYFGELIAEWSFEVWARVEKRIELPAGLISRDWSPAFTFRTMNPASPLELNQLNDPRLLGLGFISLRMEPEKV